MRENQASTRLAKGTIVYMIGNISSKILQMLILPIITVTLQTSEYGYYDLIITTISFVIPIITFQMIEGMFRFMFNASEDEKQKTVTTVTTFLLGGLIVLAGIILMLKIVVPTLKYPFLIYLNYATNIIFNYAQKLVRCRGKNKEFAISGVLHTIIMLGMQAVTLLLLNMSVDGMLIANAFSYIGAALYLLAQLNIKQWIKKGCFDKVTFKNLFKYSAPLIPNSIGWWLVASSDRYIISFLLDTAANGIYSIAGKFSQLLTFVTTVFQLAWQESAIMEENSETRDKFYTDTFNTYMKLLMGGYLVVLPFIKLVIPILLEKSYQVGYIYTPILLIGAIFSAFSQFYGSAYLVFKKTGGAFTTTMVAAVINITIGVRLISKIGLFAPALGTATSFMIQWFIRVYQMKDYFKVKVNWKALVSLIIFMIISTSIYYMKSTSIQLVSMLIGGCIFVIYNHEILLTCLKKILRK